MGGRGAVSATSVTSHALATAAHLHDGDFSLTTDDSVEIIARALGEDKETAYKHWNAITNYTAQWYGAVRKHQRAGGGTETVREMSKQIEDYIAKAPKWDGGTTFRGITDVSDSVLDSLTTEGTVFDMRGTSSWSSKESVAKSFANSGYNDIVFESVTQSKGTSVRHISRYPTEDEILVSKSSQYRVSSAKFDKNNKVWRIKVEEA